MGRNTQADKDKDQAQDAPTEQAAEDQPTALGGEQVQEEVAKAQEQGYFGTKTDPRPNSDYSLESGPDSPSPAEADLRVNIDDLAPAPAEDEGK